MTYRQPTKGYYECDACGREIAHGRSMYSGWVYTLKAGEPVVAGKPPFPQYHFHLLCMPLRPR